MTGSGMADTGDTSLKAILGQRSHAYAWKSPEFGQVV
jgi:hypothetical protein